MAEKHDYNEEVLILAEQVIAVPEWNGTYLTDEYEELVGIKDAADALVGAIHVVRTHALFKLKQAARDRKARKE